MDSSPPDLARRVDQAQSILDTPAAAQARRLERALAASCRSFAAAMARLDPGSRASALDTPAGVAVFAGAGSPLTQGLATGLTGPVSSADLDRLEPMAPPPPGIEVRRIRPGEEEAQVRSVLAAFLEAEEVPEEAVAMLRPGAFAEGHELYLALVDGEPAGGATLAWSGGVALVNGSGVRRAYRRRGIQGALIRARLDRARELGCDLASSSTLPGTPSRRNMERHGFHVAYPKLVMLRER